MSLPEADYDLLLLNFHCFDSKYAKLFTLCGQHHFVLLSPWFFFTTSWVWLHFLVHCCWFLCSPSRYKSFVSWFLSYHWFWVCLVLICLTFLFADLTYIYKYFVAIMLGILIVKSQLLCIIHLLNSKFHSW